MRRWPDGLVPGGRRVLLRPLFSTGFCLLGGECSWGSWHKICKGSDALPQERSGGSDSDILRTAVKAGLRSSAVKGSLRPSAVRCKHVNCGDASNNSDLVRPFLCEVNITCVAAATHPRLTCPNRGHSWPEAAILASPRRFTASEVR